MKFSFDLIFCQTLMSQMLLQHFISKSINIMIGEKLEEVNLGSPEIGLLFIFFLSGSNVELEFSYGFLNS